MRPAVAPFLLLFDTFCSRMPRSRLVGEDVAPPGLHLCYGRFVRRDGGVKYPPNKVTNLSRPAFPSPSLGVHLSS